MIVREIHLHDKEVPVPSDIEPQAAFQPGMKKREKREQKRLKQESLLKCPFSLEKARTAIGEVLPPKYGLCGPDDDDDEATHDNPTTLCPQSKDCPGCAQRRLNIKLKFNDDVTLTKEEIKLLLAPVAHIDPKELMKRIIKRFELGNVINSLPEQKTALDQALFKHASKEMADRRSFNMMRVSYAEFASNGQVSRIWCCISNENGSDPDMKFARGVRRPSESKAPKFPIKSPDPAPANPFKECDTREGGTILPRKTPPARPSMGKKCRELCAAPNDSVASSNPPFTWGTPTRPSPAAHSPWSPNGHKMSQPLITNGSPILNGGSRLSSAGLANGHGRSENQHKNEQPAPVFPSSPLNLPLIPELGNTPRPPLQPRSGNIITEATIQRILGNRSSPYGPSANAAPGPSRPDTNGLGCAATLASGAAFRGVKVMTREEQAKILEDKAKKEAKAAANNTANGTLPPPKKRTSAKKSRDHGTAQAARGAGPAQFQGLNGTRNPDPGSLEARNTQKRNSESRVSQTRKVNGDVSDSNDGFTKPNKNGKGF
ncbi:hypothetical protein EJ06DRAFT_585011 [Trichodelitschia bisporula]|uniref:Uncharacterized protein n=1 Tax=Trichodelitschia bisporula TaxID=703511 RepID=A0A6G1HKW6_9PEZI|nr:hypothetical protein EJ06DRAFT_585011 [Trichodelitschia bisporula]